MSRYRNIHCMVWNDDKFPFVSDDCKLVFFHLLTTPFSTPFGLYKASINALADEMRWSPKRYEKAFREALAKGFLKYDERHYLVYLPRFLKHNPPSNPNVLKSWAGIYSELPPSPLKAEWYQALKELVEGFGEGFREAFAKGFGKGMPIQEQEQYQEQYQYQEQNTPPNPPTGGERFHAPTIEEVEAYCAERRNNVSAVDFVNFYEAKGWMIGKNKMRDWRAAVRTWERREPERRPRRVTTKTEGNYAILEKIYRESRGEA